MADTLAREVHLNHQQKRMIIALVVVVLILLLLWSRKTGPNTVNNKNIIERLGDLVNQPAYINYDVPGLDLPPARGLGAGPWDWMQTTDCACDCDENWTPATPAQIVTTQYAYIGAPIIAAAPALPNFPVYTAPPLKKWWYEWGYNVHHEQAMYVMTEDGVNGILGKYSRSAWNDPERRGSYPQQTKSVTLQGNDAYVDGRHYTHDPRKDKPRPPAPPASYAVAWG